MCYVYSDMSVYFSVKHCMIPLAKGLWKGRGSQAITIGKREIEIIHSILSSRDYGNMQEVKL